jgi:hypothetical protein
MFDEGDASINIVALQESWGSKGVRSDAPSLQFPATGQRWGDEGETTMLRGKSNGRNSAVELREIEKPKLLSRLVKRRYTERDLHAESSYGKAVGDLTLPAYSFVAQESQG